MLQHCHGTFELLRTALAAIHEGRRDVDWSRAAAETALQRVMQCQKQTDIPLLLPLVISVSTLSMLSPELFSCHLPMHCSCDRLLTTTGANIINIVYLKAKLLKHCPLAHSTSQTSPPVPYSASHLPCFADERDKDKKWSQEEMKQFAPGHTMCQWQRNFIPFQLAPKSSQENDRNCSSGSMHGTSTLSQGMPGPLGNSIWIQLLAAFNFPMIVRAGGVCPPTTQEVKSP